MKKNYVFIILIFLLITVRSFNLSAQCTVDFSFTQGANGLVNFTPIVTNPGTSIQCNWYFGDGLYQGFTSIAATSHNYTYNYSARVCLEVFSNTCSDSLCKDVVLTTAPQNPSCPGNAVVTASVNGTQTEFSNSSGQDWGITDLGDGTYYPPTYIPAGNTFSHQYQVNGTYAVSSISLFQMNPGFYYPCDNQTQNVIINNVPCLSDFTLNVDTNQYGFYVSNYSLGGANFRWYLDGVLISNSRYCEKYNMLPGNYTLCMAMDGPSCYDSTCKTFALTYSPPCTNVTFTYTPVIGQCNTYTFNINNGGTTLSDTDWFLNGSLISTSANAVITLSGTNFDEVTGVAYGVNGCYSSQSFNFWNKADFNVYLDTTGAINTWYAYSYSGQTSSELWDFGDGTTSTLGAPTHTYTAAGYYNVCHSVVDLSGCSYSYCLNQYFYRPLGAASQFIVIASATSVKENEFSSIKNIYPNPANDIINIDFQKNNSVRTVELLNSIGQSVFKKIVNSSSVKLQIPVAENTEGLYFLLIKGENASEIKKVMITR